MRNRQSLLGCGPLRTRRVGSVREHTETASRTQQGLLATHRLARGILIAANRSECGCLEPDRSQCGWLEPPISRSVSVWNPLGMWGGLGVCSPLEPPRSLGVWSHAVPFAGRPEELVSYVHVYLGIDTDTWALLLVFYRSLDGTGPGSPDRPGSTRSC